MNGRIAREILTRELSTWRAKPYPELIKLINKSQTAEVIGPDQKIDQIAIQVLWDSKRGRDIRVLGAIDDGGFRAFFPLSDSFILSSNGNFVGE